MSNVPESAGPDMVRKPSDAGLDQSAVCAAPDENAMKPMCPHCGSLMSFSGIKSRSSRALPELRTFCCEPCHCVFSDALTPTGTAARAMLLDLQANVHLGAMH
jgi:transposase-like protein